RSALEDIIRRVRDEQDVDLAEFDINGPNGTPDGYFDGVIIDTDMYSGIGFPLNALGNMVTVPTAQGSTDAGPAGETLGCGIAALIPPENHEFGHVLGFIDLYGGPDVNDLMMDTDSMLGPFGRMQIGWATATEATGDMEIDLAPALAGGQILKFGT